MWEVAWVGSSRKSRRGLAAGAVTEGGRGGLLFACCSPPGPLPSGVPLLPIPPLPCQDFLVSPSRQVSGTLRGAQRGEGAKPYPAQRPPYARWKLPREAGFLEAVGIGRGA